MKIPIEISARHIHLCKKDLEKLFGTKYGLKILKQLSQPNQFAAKETIIVAGPKGEIKNVRIIGPCRNQTQLEISITDSYILGIDPPPILESGSLDKSGGGVKIIGPNDSIDLKKGIIVAQRHLHASLNEAKKMGIAHHDIIKIKTLGTRSVIYNNVIVRSRKGIDKLSFQIDSDEANAGGVKTGDKGEIFENS